MRLFSKENVLKNLGRRAGALILGLAALVENIYQLHAITERASSTYLPISRQEALVARIMLNAGFAAIYALAITFASDAQE